MKGVVCFLALLSCTSISTDLATAQAPLSFNNPLDVFSFDPQEVMRFLLGSVKPEYIDIYRDKQVLGNASIYLVQLINRVLPANLSQQLITSRLGQELFDVIDSEMINLYKDMDTTTATPEEMLERLMEFDTSKLLDVILAQPLSNILGALPQNMTEQLRTILTKLHNNQSIADDLTQLIRGLPLSMFDTTYLVEKLDVALRELTQVLLETEPDWPTAADLYNIPATLMQFDFQKFGMDLIQPVLRLIDRSLPGQQKRMLSDFLQNLNNSQPLNLKQGLPEVYEFLMDQLNPGSLSNISANMDFRLMEFFGVFNAIEVELVKAMNRTKMAPTRSPLIWTDPADITDMEHLARVLSFVDFTSIGQSIMGNILNVIADDQQIIPFTHELFTQLFEGLNLTTSSDVLLNTTTDIFVQVLQESLQNQMTHPNWTASLNSEKLGMVFTGADWANVARRLFIAVLKEEEAILPTAMKVQIQEVVTLIDTGSKTAIINRLSQQFDMIHQMVWQTPAPVPFPAKQALLETIAEELIDTYQLVQSGNDSIATPLLNQSGLTFSNLTDTEKLVYTLVSVNYMTIGETIKDQVNIALEHEAGRVLGMLERKESIVPAFKALISTIQKIPPIDAYLGSTIQGAMSSSLMTNVLDDISKQLIDLYIQESSNTTVWQSLLTNRTRLMYLLTQYNYMHTGDVIVQTLLDSRLPAVSAIIDDFISKVEHKGSVFDIVKQLRNKLVETFPSMQWLTLDAILPISTFIDEHIKNLTTGQQRLWNTADGNLPKVYTFLQTINYTKLLPEIQTVGFRLAANFFSRGLVTALPKEVRLVMVDVMSVIESGGLMDGFGDMLDNITGNNPMAKWLANTTMTHNIMEALSDSIMATYKEVRRTTDSEWRLMSTEEKFLRVMLRLDVPQMMMDMFEVAKKTSSSSPFLYPKYSKQCTQDLDSVSYALGQVTTDPGKAMWAMKLVDAWGKLPEGLMQMRFTWPGEMNECEGVRGDRVQVVNETSGEVVVIKKDGVKGAWTMANVEIPVPAGSSFAAPFMPPGENKITLNWGICLPATCEYNDIMTFMGRLGAFGAKIPYVKPRASYPALNGSWRKDAMFIGVSAYLLLLIIMVGVSTVVDRLVLMKREEKRKRKEEVYAMNDMKGGLVHNDLGKAHENGGYVTDKEQVANGSLEAGTKANGDVREHIAAKKENHKPGVGILLLKSFSLYQNLPRLMDSASKPNQLQALDGIRFLSMTWVILGHVYSFILGGGYTQNIATIATVGSKGNWEFYGVSGGFFAVDTFFLLSGLLVGYLFLKMLDKVKGKVGGMTMILYYVHRVIRLLPLYASIIMFSVAYSNYLGTGPLNWWYSDAIKNPCDTNWWTNLLYVNNFVNDKQMCAGWSWYLANDMQFYVISPLLLLPLYWFPKIGFVLIVVLWTACAAVTGWQWGQRNGGGQMTDQAVFNDIYIKPWARIGPYVIGIILAYMLFKKIRIKSGAIQAVWWVVSFGLMALAVYMPYDATKEDGLFSSSWNATERAAYETLSKSAWALAVAWIIFACNTGCGGFIGDGLCWGGWAPLSRMTYAAYLIHPFVLDLNYKNRHNLIYIDNNQLIHDDIAFVAITYMVAFLLHLIIEAPMLGIEKLILPRK